MLLIVTTDGRADFITQTLTSAAGKLRGDFTRRVIHDDSGDPAYRTWLAEQFPEFEVIGDGPRVGYSAAMTRAWATVAASRDRYVFWLEDDFTFNEPVDLTAMAATLDGRPDIAQLVLMRQAWYPHEIEAGGIVQANPKAFTVNGNLVEHRQFWSMNPCLFRTSLARTKRWPTGPWSESRLGASLLVDPKARFAFYGTTPTVTHIGAFRVGTDY